MVNGLEDEFKTGLRFIKIKLIDKQIQLVFITGRDGLSEEIVKQHLRMIIADRISIIPKQ